MTYVEWYQAGYRAGTEAKQNGESDDCLYQPSRFLKDDGYWTGWIDAYRGKESRHPESDQ